MNILQVVKKELLKYNIETSKFEILSNKNGKLVVRLSDLGYVFKMFFSLYSREIDIYRLFNRLGVKTARVIEFKENSILLEDIKESDYYHMATEEDLKNPQVVRALAKWYQNIQKQGYDYFINNDADFHSEIDELTKKDFFALREHTEYDDGEFWRKLKEILPLVKAYTKENRTFTYNEFNLNDLVVSNDYNDAYMLDYSYLGWGLPYFDYRDLASNELIKPEDIEVLANYLDVNVLDQQIDSVFNPIISLLHAYHSIDLPEWANEYYMSLRSGEVKESLEELINTFKSYEEVEILRLADGDLTIRNAKVSDIEQFVTWWEDGEVMAHAGFPNGLKVDRDELKLKHIINNASGIEQLRLVVLYKGKPIGEASYRLVSKQVYDFGIKICDVNYQNLGIGTRAIDLMMTLIINDLKAKRIVLSTTPENARARKVYERLGFIQTDLKEGSWVDQLGNKRSSVHYELNIDDFRLNRY